WMRGWLHTRGWLDGMGVVAVGDGPRSERDVLVWYLSTMAAAEPAWVRLEQFLDEVFTVHQGSSWSRWGVKGWDPDFPSTRAKEDLTGEPRRRAWWLAQEGRWYANALMVTLPWRGVVERGRASEGEGSPWCFRLTPLGRAVFAAPDAIAVPPEPNEPFLVVQPNFDVVAYLDRASIAAGATLGGLTEGAAGAASAGPVQPVRLTPASVYLALENGISQSEILEFLRSQARNELPANVAQSLAEWSAKREAVVVRQGVDFL